MRTITTATIFMLLCACHSSNSPEAADAIPPAAGFAAMKAESPVPGLEWSLQQGQQGSPVQVVSCAVNRKQEVVLAYRNASAEEIDGVRVVLFGYNDAGAHTDVAEGVPYLYITDQQVVAPGKPATLVYPLQQQLSKVVAYVVKVHYTAGGSWENH